MDNRYLATTNKESNKNYLGPAPLEEMARYDIRLAFALLDCATEPVVNLWNNLCPFSKKTFAVFRQIYLAEGPSGPNKEYVFKLEDALNKLGEYNKCLPFYRICKNNLKRGFQSSNIC
jgi:cation transport protein ChaC